MTSVCNGAFSLANTGLLDGLGATTTAGNINRFSQTDPNITAARGQRVVDNGGGPWAPNSSFGGAEERGAPGRLAACA